MQHVVVAPVARIFRYLQQRCVGSCEGTAEVSLRSHVRDRVGQAFEPAIAHGLVHRPRESGCVECAAVRLDQLEFARFVRMAFRIDLEQGNRLASPPQRARGGVGGAPGAAADDHAVAGCANGSHQGGTAGAQTVEHTRRRQGAGSAEQSQEWLDIHETISKRSRH